MDSSIWDEPDNVFRTFIAMMALKDADHIVRLTPYQLSRRIRRSEKEVMEALIILSNPDTRREEKQEFEGRRIEAVDEGWLVLNGPKYRAMVSLEMRRARNRRSQAAFRERQKVDNQTSTENENEGVDCNVRRDPAEDAYDQQEAVRKENPHQPPVFVPPDLVAREKERRTEAVIQTNTPIAGFCSHDQTREVGNTLVCSVCGEVLIP